MLVSLHYCRFLIARDAHPLGDHKFSRPTSDIQRVRDSIPGKDISFVSLVYNVVLVRLNIYRDFISYFMVNKNNGIFLKQLKIKRIYIRDLSILLILYNLQMFEKFIIGVIISDNLVLRLFIVIRSGKNIGSIHFMCSLRKFLFTNLK